MKLDKLDMLRGFAALYVALGHWVDCNEATPLIIRQALRFGQQSVILFFLLSGFVIYIATSRAENVPFRDYFIKRFRRIYPVMLGAFLVSFIISFIDGNFFELFNGKVLIGNLLMLQDYGTDKPGLWFTYFMRNSPLWSLSYEWWFYMLFFVFYKFLIRSPYRLLTAFMISFASAITYIIYPNHASLVFAYFIIWWTGYEAADVYFKQKTFTFQNMKWLIASNFAILALFMVYQFSQHQIESAIGIEAIIVKKPIIHFSTCVFFLGFGLFWWRFQLIGFNQLMGVFLYVAPISYALYVLHFPILKIWDLYKYFDYKESILNMVIVNSIRITVLITLSYLMEIKIQPIINKYLK